MRFSGRVALPRALSLPAVLRLRPCPHRCQEQQHGGRVEQRRNYENEPRLCRAGISNAPPRRSSPAGAGQIVGSAQRPRQRRRYPAEAERLRGRLAGAARVVHSILSLATSPA
jgi:hypothetical protein